MAIFTKLSDYLGRTIRPILGKFGTDDYREIVVDTNGVLKTISQANSGVDIGDVDILSIAAGTNVIGKVRLVDTSGDDITDDTNAAIKSRDDFGGNVYSNTLTMANNNATRFETSTKKLRDVVILVETFGMLLGETGVEVYTVAASGSIGFTKVDISTLYFKNAVADSNGKISIIGTEE